MALSIYVHIPYCLQRCSYCDFVTFEQNQIMPPENYLTLLLREIENRHHVFSDRTLRSIYFGGGTPSLVPAEHIVAIIEALAKSGFIIQSQTEITIEINPATIDVKKLAIYLQAGVNRFSVGAQTFNDTLLKKCGRRHSSDDTRLTLKLLDQAMINYSFDLLFALPGQSLADLKVDLREVAHFRPRHLSAYCLTIPDGHPLSFNRPPEDEQIDMFHFIEDELNGLGLSKYEISNFAQPGFESVHNLSYWSNIPYWGIGLSAHSYDPDQGNGVRYWNPSTFHEYAKQTELRAEESLFKILPSSQYERLNEFEALTDYCHMFLRTQRGLNKKDLKEQFPRHNQLAISKLDTMLRVGEWLDFSDDVYRLTKQGYMLCNMVLRELTFSAPPMAERAKMLASR